MTYEYMTVDQALVALEAAEFDCTRDFGEEMVEQAWPDLVIAVADFCSPTVRKEFLRTQGIVEREV